MKKLLSIVLTVALLLSMVACIPVAAIEGEEAVVDTSTLGDYYKFTFGADGDQYDYTVANNKADDTTGQANYKGNDFYPFWIQSADAANAEIGYKTITTADNETFDVLEIKNYANGWLVPLTKEGKPFEMTPGVNYNVNVKLFNPVSNCWGQYFVGAGTTDSKIYKTVNGIQYSTSAEGVVTATPKKTMYSTCPYGKASGGSVGGNSYSFYAKEGSYGKTQQAVSCIHSQYTDAEGNPLVCSTSRYVTAYSDSTGIVAIPEEAGTYNEETNSYEVKTAFTDETPDDTSDDTYDVGNNYLVLSLSGGNVLTYASNPSYHVFSNASAEEIGEKAPSTWQIVSIEVVSENFKSNLSYSVNGEIVKTFEGEVGSTLEAPAIPEAPEGKYFAGWFIDEACTQLYTATTLEFGQNTVYAGFKDYGTSLKVDFDDNAYTASSTAVYYSPVGTKWPLTGYSWKGNSYDSQENKGQLKAHLERNGLSTEFPASTVAFYSDRTWGMPGGIMLANEDGTLFVPEAGETYRVTYKYMAPVHNGNNMSINVVYGIVDSMAGLSSTGDKAFMKSTLAWKTIDAAVPEWTVESKTVTIPEEGEGYVPALGLNIAGVKKVAVDLDGDGATDGAADGFDYTAILLDYIEVEKVPTTTVTFVKADGSESSAVVEIGAEINYPYLDANRNKDVAWSRSADEYVAAPKVATEAITVYAVESDVISFENYVKADYLKYSLNVQTSEDYAYTGNKSLKYENIGYAITSVVPSDWETNWTKYYEIVDGEIVQLAGEVAPEWVANTYLQHRGNNNLEQSIALWQLDGNKSYKVSFKYYVPEALTGDVEIYPFTNGSNIWWNQTDGNGKGKIDYMASAITIGADAAAGEWLDGEFYFTSTAIPSYDLLYVKVGTAVEEQVIIYFDDFKYEEVDIVTFEIPEGAAVESEGQVVDGILTIYIAKGGVATAPVVIDADGNPIDVWYDKDGNEVTEFVAGAYTSQSFIYGDCNGDQLIDAADLASLKLNLAGSGDVGPGADCNGDGVIDAADLAALKLYLAGSGTLGPAN